MPQENRNLRSSSSSNVEDDNLRQKIPRLKTIFRLPRNFRLPREEQNNTRVPLLILPFNSQDLTEAVDKNDHKTCENLIRGYDNWASKCDQTNHPFFLSAERGYFDVLCILLKYKGNLDINMQNKKGHTALHFALENQRLDCCNILLDNNIKGNTADINGNSALHYAAEKGYRYHKIISRIVSQYSNMNPISKFNLDAQNKKGRTCLHVAANEFDSDMVDFLLSMKADSLAKDKYERIPLHFAADNNYHSCCDSLLNNSESDQIKSKQLEAVLKDGSTPLILAAIKGYYECCKSLNGSQINHKDLRGNTALHCAVSKGSLYTVDVLMEQNADVLIKNNKGHTALHNAFKKQDSTIFKRLAKSSENLLDLNNDNETVLHFAALLDLTDILEDLLEKQIYQDEINKKDRKGRTALHRAVKYENLECARLLIDKGADVYIKDHNENSSIHIAAASGLKKMCHLLVSNGRTKNINDANKDGLTPFHLAVKKDSTECCLFFKENGVKMFTANREGNMAIHIAAIEGRLETLTQLIKFNFQLDKTVENTGNTPLHLAAIHGYLECCKLLFNSHKGVYLKLNEDKRMAVDEAFLAHHDEVFEFLLMNHKQPKVGAFVPEHDQEFQARIHKYMHIALKEQRSVVQKAIVESGWWFAGFHSSSCNTPCGNLKQLVRDDPNLTSLVFDKCIVPVSDGEKEYNFRLFETSFYISEEDFQCYTRSKDKGCKGLYTVINVEDDKSTASSSAVSKKTFIASRTMPFDSSTGELVDNALENNDTQWSSEHVLGAAANCKHLGLIQHPLTRTYLTHNWDSYIWGICLIYMLLEILGTLSLSFYLGVCWNFDQITEKHNISKDDFSIHFGDSELSFVFKFWWMRTIGFVLVLLFLIVFSIMEINNMIKSVKYHMFYWEAIMGWIRILTTFVLILPLNVYKYKDFGIIETWQWQSGIIALLTSWFIMIHIINRYPPFSIFMPVTTAFMKSFFKMIIYIFLILLLFSYIFHLLLSAQKPFDNIPKSFVKTLTWFLGDLGYDGTFVEGTGLLYPIMTTLIFVVFITSLTGFIFNLIISEPFGHLEHYREEATLFKELNNIALFLHIGRMCPGFRKKNTLGFKKVKEENQERCGAFFFVKKMYVCLKKLFVKEE